MIDHFSIKVSDLKKSKDFYKQTLYPLGYKICFDTDYVISFVSPEGADPAGDFWISQGEPSGNHFAFTSNTKESVDLFYESGLKAGVSLTVRRALDLSIMKITMQLFY